MHTDLFWEQLIALNLFEVQKGLNTNGSSEECNGCRATNVCQQLDILKREYLLSFQHSLGIGQTYPPNLSANLVQPKMDLVCQDNGNWIGLAIGIFFPKHN